MGRYDFAGRFAACADTYPGADASREVSSSPLRDLAEGFRYVKAAPVLLSLGLMNVVTNFVIAGPGSLSIPLIASDVLQGSSVDLSFLESAISIGMIAGAVAVGLLNPKRRRGVIILGQLLLLGAVMVLLSGAVQLWQHVVLFAVLGSIITFGSIPVSAMIQQQTEPHMMGRVMSMMSAVSGGLVPLSFACSSFLLSQGVAITQLLLVCGFIVIAYFVVLLLFAKRIRAID
nr:MFS transporter [Paenibacillus protaetiae]